MDAKLRSHAEQIVADAIRAVLPDEAVQRALTNKEFPGRVILVAAGKAAWQMAKAAYNCLGDRITDGIVITKYHHVKEPIPHIQCFEAGHPVPDENTFLATRKALELTENLTDTDTVLFLLSGGGSALFEDPLVPGEELQDITRQLLASGADITEINTIRKRLSKVKGGRFALHCRPAKVFGIALSDVLGDAPDKIASGPVSPDKSTCQQAVGIAEKYNLQLTDFAYRLLMQETPKEISNVELQITGSVRQLCNGAAESCKALGYKPILLTDVLSCQAREAGTFLANILQTHADTKESLAFIAGGETVVKLTGNGLGGRNQELALAAADGIAELENVAVFSIGSDGTDGPTDAAGGYVDYETAETLRLQNVNLYEVLQNNDAYHALQKTDGLIFTGPTGTNVNDVAVGLLYRGE